MSKILIKSTDDTLTACQRYILTLISCQLCNRNIADFVITSDKSKDIAALVTIGNAI